MEYINIIITVLLILFIFYLAQQQKKRQEKQLKQMQDELKIGDRIITYSGLSGVIEEVSKEQVIIKINPEENIRISIEKWAVAGIDDREKTR